MAVRQLIPFLNRSLTIVVNDMTLGKAWSGEKKSVDYF